jgi:chemotaxis protein MotB
VSAIHRGARVVVAAWIVATALSTTGCVSAERYQRAKNTIDQQDAVIGNYEGEFSALQAKVGGLQEQLDRQNAELNRARTSASALRDANESLNEKYDDLRASMSRDALPSGVTIEPRADGLAFQVEGAILFDSGKTEIKEDGKNILLDIIARIRDGAERIRVEGHTDNVPVTNTKHLYPLGNLQLSGERALNVADFLRGHGIRSDRVYYAGMGEHDPRASNDTPEGRAQNRRVEIVLVFEPQN